MSHFLQILQNQLAAQLPLNQNTAKLQIKYTIALNFMILNHEWLLKNCHIDSQYYPLTICIGTPQLQEEHYQEETLVIRIFYQWAPTAVERR